MLVATPDQLVTTFFYVLRWFPIFTLVSYFTLVFTLVDFYVGQMFTLVS